jgi:hypothetical protein
MTPGKRIQIIRWVHGRVCVVKVTTDAVIPDADPSEPCLEPATVKWLDDVQALADRGDVDALARIGDVYVRKSA